MTENTIVRNVLAYLKAQPETWAFKVHGSPMQVAGIPDLVGVQKGRFFALEVKRADGKTTLLQEAMMRRIREAGGLVGVVRSVEDVKAVLG